MKKRLIALASLLLVVVMVLTACSSGTSTTETQTNTGSSNAGTTTTQDVTNSNAQAEITQGEVKKTSNQVNSITICNNYGAYDVTPFATPTGGRSMQELLWAKLIYLPTLGCSLEDSKMWLAKSVARVDEVTANVELYEGIHDRLGNAITAEDILWSYEMSKIYGECVETGNVWGDVEIIDDTHMVFKINSPGVNKLETMIGHLRLTVCDKDWYEGCANTDAMRVGAATTGAYYVTEWEEGSLCVLEAVEDYWKDEELRIAPEIQNVKTIRYPVVSEAAVRAASVEAGELDVANLDANAVKTFYNNGVVIDGFTVTPVKSTMGYNVFINMDVEKNTLVANNQKLRQALLYAVDADSMRRAAGYDDNSSYSMCDFACSVFSGMNPEWEETYYHYDPEKARALLAEAGYPDGISGVRWLYKIETNSAAVAAFIEGMRNAGIELELVGVDGALYNSYKFDSTAYDITLDWKGGSTLIDWWTGLFNPDGYDNWGVNFCSDAKFHDLLTKVSQTGAEEDINAFHDYCVELALGRGCYTFSSFYVAQDGIEALAFNQNNNPQPGNYTYAADYKSVED